jgi:HAD superfamily hydrolase (TIGR01509 family)
MDGTLVETEQFWGMAMSELAARHGGRMSGEARRRTVGTSMSVSMAVLHADLGLTRTQAQTHADARWVTERTVELMSGGVEWRPGAAELLRAVRAAGLRTALVTTTPRRLAEIVLASIRRDLGEDPFEVTVCGDEVAARKPDPAPYRQAMAELGVEPEECLVIEDSHAGISAGLGAGIVVLGVPEVQDVPPAAGLRLLDSLVGVDVAALEDLHAGLDLESTG